MIANPATGEVIVFKRISFKRFTSKSLVVVLPGDFTLESRLKIYIMCDSYIGLDQEYTIDLNRVNELILDKTAGNSKSTKKAKAKKTKDEKVEIQINTRAIGETGLDDT